MYSHTSTNSTSCFREKQFPWHSSSILVNSVINIEYWSYVYGYQYSFGLYTEREQKSVGNPATRHSSSKATYVATRHIRKNEALRSDQCPFVPKRKREDVLTFDLLRSSETPRKGSSLLPSLCCFIVSILLQLAPILAGVWTTKIWSRSQVLAIHI